MKILFISYLVDKTDEITPSQKYEYDDDDDDDETKNLKRERNAKNDSTSDKKRKAEDNSGSLSNSKKSKVSQPKPLKSILVIKPLNSDEENTLGVCFCLLPLLVSFLIANNSFHSYFLEYSWIW